MMDNYRILLIDDNEDILQDYKDILIKNIDFDTHAFQAILFDDDIDTTVEKKNELPSFDIETALQGEEGLELVKKSLREEKPFAVAFVDVRMPPGIDGIETVKKMWMLDPSIQVVICTAYSDYSFQDIRDQLDNSDSLIILKKPFDGIEVQQLASMLSKKWIVSYEKNEQQKILESTIAKLKLEVQQREETDDLRKAQKKLFHSIIDKTKNLILVKDFEGKYLFVNKEAEKLFYKSRDQILGKCDSEAFPPRIAEKFIRGDKELIERQVSIEYEETIDNRVSLHICKFIVPLEDGEQGICAMAMDITDKKNYENTLRHKNEELEKVNRSKDKFFSIISHDLRSPLRHIRKLTQFLMEEIEELEPEEIVDFAKKTHLSAEQLNVLLENLLKWSQNQTGMIRCSPKNLYLNDSLNEVLSLLSDGMEKKHITIIKEIAEQCKIYADKDMLNSILNNLLSNALKFTPRDGSITVTGKCEGDFTSVSISDTGIGMSQEQAENLFSGELNQTYTGTEGERGTGLGLTLCKEFVETLGGQIVVSSSVGKGSSFIFSLPQKGYEKQCLLNENCAINILVVEHDVSIQISLEKHLKDIGYSYDMVFDGTQALIAVEENSYDIILFDISLIKNIDVIKIIHDAIKVQRVNTEIVALVDEQFKTNDLNQLGIYHWIEKNCSMENLRDRVRKILHSLT